MTAKRSSIRPTYDSRETGPRYYVTTTVGDRVITFQHPMCDPFMHHTVVIGWRDLLRGLLHGQLPVVVTTGADPDLVEDVLELDENYLGQNCTRRDAFNSHIAEAAARFVNEGGQQ